MTQLLEQLHKQKLPSALIECLEAYRDKIATLLEDRLYGIYLHGSIALDAFNPKTSDIDIVILTKSRLNQNDFPRIETIHKALNNRFHWANRMEVSYIAQSEFSIKMAPKEDRIYFNKGLKWVAYGPEWLIEKHLLLTKGICLYGAFLDNLNRTKFKPTKVDLESSVKAIIDHTWYSLYDELPKLTNDYRKEAILFIRDSILRHRPSKYLSPLPLTSIYLIRHGESIYTPDEINRPISDRGRLDADILGQQLKDIQIDGVYSSPYKRAIQTVEPIAHARDLTIELVEDLRERTKTEGRLDNFLQQVKWLWDNPSKNLIKGESNEVAQRRGVEAIEGLRNDNLGKSIAIGSHGDLMALILNYYDPSYGYEFWRQLDMPDAYKLTFEGCNLKFIEHIWTREHSV